MHKTGRERDKEREGTDFVSSHAVLDEEGYPRVEIADITLEDKVFL